jgi:hypothetical protein
VALGKQSTHQFLVFFTAGKKQGFAADGVTRYFRAPGSRKDSYFLQVVRNFPASGA